MKLKSLLKDLKILYATDYKNIDIKHIAISTEKTDSETLFICLKGKNYNGHALKELAKKKGAVCFVVEEFDASFDGVQILVKNTREALSIIARNFYKPKKALKMIGITGTNGKTTTSFMIYNILKKAGKKVGVIGTEGIYFNNQKLNFNMTTPDPIELFYSLKQMSESGIEYVVMEVSAHAIYLSKVYALNFVAKGLTNITQDHLDYFETMENYSKTKLNFMESGNGIKVINIDDDYGYGLSLINKKVYTYSTSQEGDIVAYDISNDCSKYGVNIFGKEIYINAKLIGLYNVENALCAITICHLLGIEDKHIKYALENFSGVEGRMNVYQKDNKKVIIDFAHTPDALEKVLKAIRPSVNGKLYCIFGCGGNRDFNKRKVMGSVSSRLSDKVIITNDNPRFEDPMQIANEIASGINSGNYEIILNRSEAIAYAINNMQDGDVVALCGKGAENYMDEQGIKHPYSDGGEVEKWGLTRLWQ